MKQVLNVNVNPVEKTNPLSIFHKAVVDLLFALIWDLDNAR